MKRVGSRQSLSQSASLAGRIAVGFLPTAPAESYSSWIFHRTHDTPGSMTYYVIKIFITTVMVLVISEVSERSTFAGGLLASIPTVSVLAMIWLYVDTGDPMRVAGLARSIFWLVIPSLALFLTLPVLIRNGVAVPVSFVLSVALTIACYFAMLISLERVGIRL